jgi:hypothetical protein
VRVLITLDDTITLKDMKGKLASLKTAMEAKAQNVLAELGQNALKSGHWNNGLGQMGAYVNEAGIRVLAGSNNALTFTRDVTHAYRIKVADADGSLDAIESLINASSSADVEVFLNVDTVDYDIDSFGNTVFKPTVGMSIQAQDILENISQQNYAKGIKNQEADFSNRPVIRANIDRTAFYALIERDDIRAVRPIGYTDARTAQWPEEVLEAASEHGEAEVMITLRGGELFSPKTGYMSVAAIKKQTEANQRAFDDILSKLSTPVISTDAAANIEIGVLHMRIPFESLAKLYDSKDARILSVELNKPSAWTTLTNSTVLMNMASAWNSGFRAAGQNIIVVDSGVRKNHAFFTTAGVSRVTLEACFGTNVSVGGITYSTICPSPDSLGDSPLNLAGSGEPYSNLTVCNTLASLPSPYTHDCSHGTHVAGIAAGRQSASITPTNLQGVGPDANIISAQVFSYNNSSPRAGAFNSDIQKALETIHANTVAGVNNPFTVNMSIGGQVYSQTAGPTPNCDTVSPAITTAISNLTSRGVPVVAATGNNSIRNGISWPACVSKAIKVSAVVNDSIGTTLAGFANIGNPSSFVGPILLAPGGGSSTTVRSSDRATTTATKPMQGTSQATPHVAGMYAAIKAANPGGVSVADVTAWVVSTGSISVTYALPPPVNTQTYRRVRVP